MIEIHPIVSSHQPHFFPWLGYFDKMAKADLFLVNDVAQLELQSPMHRNRILDRNGTIRYINAAIEKREHEEKQNREILLSNWEETRKTLAGKIRDGYRHAYGFDEVWPMVADILAKPFTRLIDLDLETIRLGRECLGIKTPMLFHSDMHYRDGADASERLAEKLASVHTGLYLSGTGGRKYMRLDDFTKRGIYVAFQDFVYPEYPQAFKGDFVPNLSFLDLVFNCGITKSREIFWNNVHVSNEHIETWKTDPRAY